MRPRVATIDLARTAAIIAMVVFHFVRDLELFGLIRPGTTLSGGWAMFARLTAGSFLFLTGMSLVLAHEGGMRWRPYLKRLGVIVFVAITITAATYIAMPGRVITFGILHAIALSSLIAVFFLRAPFWVSGGTALSLWLGNFWFGRSFDLPYWMWWTGLRRSVSPALDFIPIVPWLAPCLLGVAFARVTIPFLMAHSTPSSAGLALLGWPGRHSLAIYLLHQPFLLGTLWVGVSIGLV